MAERSRHQPKLVKALSSSLESLKDVENQSERLEIVERVCQKLILNLATFGPILKVVHQEYQVVLKDYQKRIFIEEVLRQKAEQKLSDLYESRSNDSSSDLSPRNSLTLISIDKNYLSPRNSVSWGSIGKTKYRLMIKNLEKEKCIVEENLIVAQTENSDLKAKIKKLEESIETWNLRYDNLRDNFNAYKDAMAEQEDPFVLRLALNQSRKDFNQVVHQLNELKNQQGFTVSQSEYDQLYLQFKATEKQLETLKNDYKIIEEEKDHLIKFHKFMKR